MSTAPTPLTCAEPVHLVVSGDVAAEREADVLRVVEGLAPIAPWRRWYWSGRRRDIRCVVVAPRLLNGAVHCLLTGADELEPGGVPLLFVLRYQRSSSKKLPRDLQSVVVGAVAVAHVEKCCQSQEFG